MMMVLIVLFREKKMIILKLNPRLEADALFVLGLAPKNVRSVNQFTIVQNSIKAYIGQSTR